MTGISSALDLAKQALTVNQYALNVTGQNIANASTAGYCRQLVELSSTGTVVVGGNAYGTGVDITNITRAYNATVDDLLSAQQSNLSAYEEMSTDLSYVADIFSLGTDSALDTLTSSFWSSWEDLSNAPAGSAERLIVLESGKSVAEQFNTMASQLTELSATVGSGIEAAVTEANTITAKITDLNKSIVVLEAQGMTANDMRDERAGLVSDLSALMDVSTYEQSNGSLAVSTASGSVLLVSESGAKALSVSEGQIMWEGTGGTVDITDQISGGSIGGWLDIRDEVIPQYQAELNELAGAFIWNVNYQHSQGVGLSYSGEAVTGSYAVGESGLMSTLAFADKVDTSEAFTLWVENTGTDPATYTKVSLDLASLAPVDSAAIDVSGTANSISDTYTLTVEPAGASIGGGSDVTVTWTSAGGSGTFMVAAGDTDASVEMDGITVQLSGAAGPFEGDTFVITTDENGTPSENVSDYTLQDFADDLNGAITAAGGGITVSVTAGQIVFAPDSSDYRFAFGSDDGAVDSGLAAALGINTFFTGDDAYTMGVNGILSDTDYIAAGQIDAETGEVSTGSGANALLLAECGETPTEISLWSFDRGGTSVSNSLTVSTDGYYETMVSFLGILSSSVESNLETAETMTASLQAQRDSISAVSLDEEMINLTKYQNAYSAAAKLLSVADEMLDELLSIR